MRKIHAFTVVVCQFFLQSAHAETWALTGSDAFFGFSALARSQGVAYDADAETLAWSWELGLQLTTLDYELLENDPVAIPPNLYREGEDHIGCLDIADGVLYAPIEDGEDYLKPVIGLYDAATLEYSGRYYDLPNTLLTEGVAWVAVDETQSVAYMAEWDPTMEILVFDLENFTFLRSIYLDQTLTRIQGAKVRDGALYASSDDSALTVYRIDLQYGYVQPLMSLLSLPGVLPNDPFLEAQGLDFWPGADGSTMHVMLIQSVYASPAKGDKPFRFLPASHLYHFKKVAD